MGYLCLSKMDLLVHHAVHTIDGCEEPITGNICIRK